MKLLADLHTHSKYSKFFHGKNTIEQMAITANELGLVEIAITDHSFKHFFGTNIVNLLKAREEIDEINKWSKTKVLLGIEADIISEDGTIDIDEDVASLIDILIIGYHRMIKTDFAGFFGNQKKDKASINKATRAYINAIEKYPVTIVSHLDSVLKTDLYKIGKACADKGVMVEINNRHCNWTEDQVNDLIASGCMFVISSDAHRREDIGVVTNAMKIVKKYNIPRELIANIELEESEKSEDDKEIDGYYGIYQAKQKAKEEREERLEEIRKTQFTNNLSDEMERKLRQIAKEKGLHYEEEPDGDDLFDEYQKFRAVFAETEDLIKNAKNYLNEHALSEFDVQNSKVEDDSFVKEDESEDLSSAESFDLFNDDESEKIEEQNNENNEVEKQDVQEELNPKTENSEDDRVLNILQKKNNTAFAKVDVQKPATKSHLIHSGVDVVKNTSSKSSLGSSSSMAKNGRSIESFMQSLKEDPKAEEKKEVKSAPKTVNKRGRGGVFIGTIEDDK